MMLVGKRNLRSRGFQDMKANARRSVVISISPGGTAAAVI